MFHFLSTVVTNSRTSKNWILQLINKLLLYLPNQRRCYKVSENGVTRTQSIDRLIGDSALYLQSFASRVRQLRRIGPPSRRSLDSACAPPFWNAPPKRYLKSRSRRKRFARSKVGAQQTCTASACHTLNGSCADTWVNGSAKDNHGEHQQIVSNSPQTDGQRGIREGRGRCWLIERGGPRSGHVVSTRTVQCSPYYPWNTYKRCVPKMPRGERIDNRLVTGRGQGWLRVNAPYMLLPIRSLNWGVPVLTSVLCRKGFSFAGVFSFHQFCYVPFLFFSREKRNPLFFSLCVVYQGISVTLIEQHWHILKLFLFFTTFDLRV